MEHGTAGHGVQGEPATGAVSRSSMKHSAVPLTTTLIVEPLGTTAVGQPPCDWCGSRERAIGGVAVTVGPNTNLAYHSCCARCGQLDD